MRKSKDFEQLRNLRVKPIDLRQALNEYQIRIDDVLEGKPIEEKNCDICDGKYNVFERTFNEDFLVCENDSIRIEQIVGNVKTIRTFNVCPACSTRVVNFIKDIMKTNMQNII